MTDMNNLKMKNFITNHINADLHKGVYKDLAFRFPPEPNGYLHLGHAKSIILNSALAKMYGGKLYLRFDDTNPETEKMEYVEAIKRDANWLTLKDFDEIRYTSDYFDDLYNAAVLLIKKDLAYVDLSTEKELKDSRGGFHLPDVPTKFRNMSVEHSLELFEAMKDGKFKDGEAILRAKIDLASDNMNMRDPVIYRVRHITHYRTGDKWCIYPMYDFAHPLGDAIEKISHSLCTLEFEDHRELYDWYVDNCYDYFNWKPVELEFSRLDLEGVNLSKRNLLKVVNEHGLNWNSPEMPTVSGLRSKGITPEMIKDFVFKCGFTKVNTLIAYEDFLDSVRSVAKSAERIFAIVDPIELEFKPNSFADRVWIDKNDVMAVPDADFWRVYPGNWTRLKHGVNFLTISVTDNKVVAEIDEDSIDMKKAKVKAKVALHWLRPENTKEITLKMYNPLLIDGEFNVNCSNEKKILIADTYKVNTLYEFERFGYVYIDENHVGHLLAGMKLNKK